MAHSHLDSCHGNGNVNGPCKRTQHVGTTSPNNVVCNMLRSFVHTCCVKFEFSQTFDSSFSANISFVLVSNEACRNMLRSFVVMAMVIEMAIIVATVTAIVMAMTVVMAIACKWESELEWKCKQMRRIILCNDTQS